MSILPAHPSDRAEIRGDAPRIRCQTALMRGASFVWRACGGQCGGHQLTLIPGRKSFLISEWRCGACGGHSQSLAREGAAFLRETPDHPAPVQIPTNRSRNIRRGRERRRTACLPLARAFFVRLSTVYRTRLQLNPPRSPTYFSPSSANDAGLSRSCATRASSQAARPAISRDVRPFSRCCNKSSSSNAERRTADSA